MEKALMFLVKLICRGKKWTIILFITLLLAIVGSGILATETLIEQFNIELVFIYKMEW